MKNLIKDIKVWVRFIIFIIIWICVLFVSDTTMVIGLAAIKKLPDAVTIYVILAFIFTRWAWKLPIFKGWLVTFPNIEGTWKGTLQSTWVDSNNDQNISPKNITVAIKQTFSSVSCTMYTDESESYSTAAQIIEDDESGIFRLSYNYTNRPRATVRDRSAIHDGAAILKIINKPEMKLEGEYWTSRRTTGDISVKFASKKIAQDFQI